MKKLFTILIAQMILSGLIAQSPEKMSYQAIIRNSSNQLVTNQAVGMKISVLQGTSTGTIVYQEIYNPDPQTNANGLVSIEIGGGIPITGNFSSIDWASGPYFLKTETDPTGGTNYTITGISQLLSVPYALYAEKAGSGFSGNYNDLTGRPDFARWDKDSTDNVTLTGDQAIEGIKTFTGEINAGNNRITHAAIPINDYDAANKFYIDSLLNQLYAQGALRVKDFDGNYYNTIKIGNQIWMAENLKTTHYNDGTEIPIVTDKTEWLNLSTAAYCWYDNNDTIYKNTYGALYNWYAVNTEKLCPVGWHVTSNAEWITLAYLFGGGDVAGYISIKVSKT